jgi:beta-phosphoglucomutase-like phosphatase (HAD superfamily)
VQARLQAGYFAPDFAVSFATLFDFNGVLVDDEAVHLAAFREALAPLGIRVSDEDYFSRYIGFDDVGAFAAILQDAGKPAPRDVVDRLVENKRPLYRRRAEAGLELFPGGASLVRRRAELGIVGVVSGALTDEIEFGLGQLGVRQCVSFVIGAERTQHSKPDPEGYLLAVAQLGHSRAVVLEDSVAGVQAARAARLACVAVTHSATRQELLDAGACLVRPTLTDLSDEDFSVALAGGGE